MTADEIFQELLSIRSRLDALPNDAAERVELELRRGRLHDLAASLDPEHGRRLEHQARETARRVEEVEKMRLDGANMAGLVGIGGGLDPEVLKFVNDHIEKNHDLEGLRAELARLRNHLPGDDDSRGSSPAR